MTRKRWEAKTEITPELIQFREKRKWQINLRRYVLEKSPCPGYAPFFALDIENLRRWFECQFPDGANWENFAKYWQFGHVIPVSYFDHARDEELKLCWNFVNLRVEQLGGKEQKPFDLQSAKGFFETLYNSSGYIFAKKLKEKIEEFSSPEIPKQKTQEEFLVYHKTYLDQITNYPVFGFELLNRGLSPEEVEKEIAFLNKNIQS